MPGPHRSPVLFVAVAMFFLLLGQKDIVNSHEARVAQTARMMASAGMPWNARPVNMPVMRLRVGDNGQKELRADTGGRRVAVNPWLVPVINDQMRLKKPPLPYWCAAMVYRLAGVGEWQARCCSALLGAVATMLIWDLASMILGRRAGAIAAGVWLTTHFIVDEYRKSMADPYLAFFTLLCAWSWTRAQLRCSDNDSTAPAQLRQPAARRHLVEIATFYLSLALGTLAKGPVIFVTVLFALVAIHFFRKTRIRSLSAHTLGFICFLAIALPWPIFIIRHVPNALDVWRYESIGEMTGENIEKARPWWTYIGNCFQLSLPWTPMWIGGFVMLLVHGRRGMTSPRGRRRRVAVLWMVLTVAFFSLLSVKKAAYLLPAMPAQTLMITDALVMLLAFARRTRLRAMPGILASAQGLVGIGFALGLSRFLWRDIDNRWLGVGLGAFIVTATALALAPIAMRKPGWWLVSQVSAYAILLIVLIGFYQARTETRNRSGRAFAEAMAAYIVNHQTPLFVYCLPEDLAFYLPLTLPSASEDAPAALLAVDHSPKDPPETLESLGRNIDGAQVIDARRIDLKAADGKGWWRLFELTLRRIAVRI